MPDRCSWERGGKEKWKFRLWRKKRSRNRAIRIRFVWKSARGSLRVVHRYRRMGRRSQFNWWQSRSAWNRKNLIEGLEKCSWKFLIQNPFLKLERALSRAERAISASHWSVERITSHWASAHTVCSATRRVSVVARAHRALIIRNYTWDKSYVGRAHRQRPNTRKWVQIKRQIVKYKEKHLKVTN